jgi:NADPH:quinone reductase-like Zn-dependent oxidoreductase
MLNPSLSCGQCEQCIRGEDSLCEDFQIVGEHTPGTFAEYFSVPHKNLCKIPKGIGYKEAAGFSLVHLTSWRLLLTRAKLQKGESVLIHGIGGGVATAALGIAKLSGANPIIVTSSSDSKLQRALDLGADYCLNYKSADLIKNVRLLTAGRGVDVIVDCVGSATWLQSLKMAAKGGKIVTCGATTGSNPETEIRLIFWKQLSILGSTMGTSEEYREIVSRLAEGELTPVTAAVFQLNQGRKALHYLSKNQQFGKVILDIP